MEETDPQSWKIENRDDSFDEQNGDLEILVDTIELEAFPSKDKKTTEEMLKQLLLFTSKMLRSGNIPHFFIRNINLLRIAGFEETEISCCTKDYWKKKFKIFKKEEVKLADELDKIAKNIISKFIYDQLIHHSFILRAKMVNTLIEERMINEVEPKY